MLLKGLMCGALCLGLMFAFTACTEDDDTTGPGDENTNTITGTVHLPDSLAGYVVCMGTLEGWLDFWTDGVDTTLLELSYSYDGTGPIQADNVITLAAGDVERTFSFELPTDTYEQVDFVVAWVDRDGDSAIETADDGFGNLVIVEQTRVPLKEYEGATYVIDGLGYFASGSDVEYLLFIDNQNLGLSIVGNSGFDFYFQ